MTEQLVESTVLEGLVEELPEGDETRGAPCWVRAEAAGGPCKRPSVARVYGFDFCEEHSTECKAGALEEFFIDAEVSFERLEANDRRAVPPMAQHIIRAGWFKVSAEWPGVPTQDEALLRAYPFRRDLMDEDFRDFDYAGGQKLGGPDPTPLDWCRHQRYVIHRLMRLAFEEEADYLLEDLEKHREHVAAQLAYTLVDYEQRRAGLRCVK